MRGLEHTAASTLFRETFVPDFERGPPPSSIGGKLCRPPCTHRFGATTGEYHVWLHTTSADATQMSEHEVNVAAQGGKTQSMQSFFKPAAPNVAPVAVAAPAPAPALAHAPAPEPAPTPASKPAEALAPQPAPAPAPEQAPAPAPAAPAPAPLGEGLAPAPTPAATMMYQCVGYRPPEYTDFLRQYPFVQHSVHALGFCTVGVP